MSLVAIVLLLSYGILFMLTIKQVLQGHIKFLLIYVALFFPIYTVFLSINYGFFESAELIKLIQYSKEVIIFSAFGMIIFGKKDLLNQSWNLSFLDKLFLAFIGLTLLFFILPLGEATIVNKALYVKNILLIGIFYFFGRNIKMDFQDWDKVFQVIFVMAICATVLVSFEKLLGTHFHSIAGLSKYMSAILERDPQGSYGLPWTFEAEGGKPRFGSFYAHPLELSSAMLIVGAAAIVYLISVKYNINRTKYLIFIACAIISILFAYSRASLVAFFMMLGFMALVLRYYKILYGALVGIVLLSIYIWFFASDEIRYFAIDTLTFQNSSSLTHIVDWLTAIESIVNYPLGIGLAMSGNASGVEQELMVGGENQFLVYGVQMGVLGMLIYIAMLWVGIRNGWRAFRLAPSVKEGIVPFIAASTKFGLLLPLMTANAEVYIYISLISWWMIGAGETTYQKYKRGSLVLST